jgi:hypothetical protein
MTYRRVGNYKFGADNHATKITDSDLSLMIELKDSLKEDYERNKIEIDRLKDENKKILRKMSNRNIADIFGISAGHCQRLIGGAKK